MKQDAACLRGFGEWLTRGVPSEDDKSTVLALIIRLHTSLIVCPGQFGDDILDLLSTGALDPFAIESEFKVADTDFGEGYKRTLRSRRCEILIENGEGRGRPRERCDACRQLGSRLRRLAPKGPAEPSSYFDRLHRRTLVAKVSKNAEKIADLNATIASKERRITALMELQSRPVDEQLESILTAAIKC